MQLFMGRYWVVILLMLSVFRPSARADGKVFAQPIATSVTTPDQRAMLYYSNGVERLVIETSFVGAGTNFAWVVPLPAPPRIEAVATNFFSCLNLAYQPHLIREADPWWLLFLLVGYAVGTGIWAYRRKHLERWFWYNLLIFVLLLLLLPMFATAGLSARSAASTSSINGINVLERQSVGIYNTVTLSGTNGTALLDWLNANGFATPKSALPAITSYAAQGWVFVAATVNREVSAGTSSRPHPLCFTFKTDKAVYPLKLTGVENPQCTIELFVFGPERAEAPGFRVEYCGIPAASQPAAKDEWFQQRELFGAARPGDFKFGNPEVLRLAFPATVTTRLVGTLTAEQMQSDAWISWSPFQPVVPTYHTRSAALGATCNWLTGIWVPGLLLLKIFSPHLQRKPIIRACLIILLLGAACGFIRYHSIKTIEVTYIRGGWFRAVNNVKELNLAIELFTKERTNSAPLTEDSFLSEFQKGDDYVRVKNAFTSQPLRCEPTPGNITLQASKITNGLDVFWYDIHGAPHKLASFPAK